MTTATATVLTPSTTDAQTTMIAMFDAILAAQQAVRDAAKATREACTIDGPHPVLETINAAKRAISAAHAACDAVDPRWRPSKATRNRFRIAPASLDRGHHPCLQPEHTRVCVTDEGFGPGWPEACR